MKSAGRGPSHQLRVMALVIAAAAVLSALTVLGVHWATAKGTTPTSMSNTQAQGLGFTPVDRKAPAVRLPNLNGHGTVSLAALAGKPIVMNFWASTCTVCKSETPAMASVARALGGQVNFVGIDSVDRHSAAVAFVTRYKVPYQIAFDPEGTAAISYGVVALPVTFFLAPSGKTIIGENIGALTAGRLRAILHKLYKIT